MKEEITIKEIKEAKAELERNLAKMIGDFEQKYGIEVYSVGFDSIKHRDELGNCLQKAFEIVKFAIVNNMIVKYKHCKQLYVKGIKNAQKFCDFNDVTFFTNNNAYKVYANSYSVVA